MKGRNMKRFLIFCFCICFYWTGTEALAGTEVYFTPSCDCENRIVSLIQEAQKQIDVAVYAINNDAIVEALKSAHNRGVQIRILTDRTQAGQKNSKVKELEQTGIPLIRHKKYRVQHDKFAIFDKQRAVTGSYNWTNSASRKNAENCFFFSDRNVKKYDKRFENLWQMNERKLKRST